MKSAVTGGGLAVMYSGQESADLPPIWRGKIKFSTMVRRQVDRLERWMAASKESEGSPTL